MSLLGGILSGVSSLFGGAASIYGSIQNRKSVQDTNNTNKEIAEYQNNWNLQQWNRENAYNDPSAVMARLKKAGLNPHLVYSNGGGTIQSAHSPSAAGYTAQPYLGNAQDANNMVQNVMSGLRFIEELQNIKLQNKIAQSQQQAIEADIIQKSIQNSLVASQTARSNFDLALAKDLRKNSIDLANNQAKLLEAQVIGQRKDNDIKDIQKEYQLLQTRYTDKQIDYLNQSLLKTSQEILNLKSQRKNINADTLRKHLENNLLKQGINPNDPAIYRMAQKALENPEYITHIIKNIGNSYVNLVKGSLNNGKKAIKASYNELVNFVKSLSR